jgi:hypothetical protein
MALIFVLANLYQVIVLMVVIVAIMMMIMACVALDCH